MTQISYCQKLRLTKMDTVATMLNLKAFFWWPLQILPVTPRSSSNTRLLTADCCIECEKHLGIVQGRFQNEIKKMHLM